MHIFSIWATGDSLEVLSISLTLQWMYLVWWQLERHTLYSLVDTIFHVQNTPRWNNVHGMPINVSLFMVMNVDTINHQEGYDLESIDDCYK